MANRVTQEFIEVVHTDAGVPRLTQVFVEAVVVERGKPRLTEIFLEVLVTNYSPTVPSAGRKYGPAVQIG